MSNDTYFGEFTYPLGRIQELVSNPATRVITRSSLSSAKSMGFMEKDIVKAVLALQPSNIYKTMESSTNPGSFQDVYRSVYKLNRLYIKLRISTDGKGVVISFKEDTSEGGV